MKAKTKKKAVKKELEYSLTLTLGNDVYSGTGATLLEALSSMPVPHKITTKAMLSITDGTRNAERMYMPVAAKRLFYPLAQKFLAKQLAYLLK